MSKDDSPPPYEDAVTQPKYANFPEQTQQGNPLPPPPTYTPSPNMYGGPQVGWGHPGVYSQSGMWMASGFGPAGLPTTIPTLSAGVPSSNTGFCFFFP